MKEWSFILLLYFYLFSIQGDLGPVGPQGPMGIPGIGSQGEQVTNALALPWPNAEFAEGQSCKHQ